MKNSSTKNRKKEVFTLVTIIAKLRAVPGKESFLADECIKMATAVRENEKKCLTYIPYVSIEDPSVVVIIEKYQDAASFDEHKSTPYFKALVETISPFLAEALDIQRFDA